MSQWTHILGIIRFDSFNLNVYPEPENQKTLVQQEKIEISKIFKKFPVPSGSEGPLQIKSILTKRGPTIIITGDLRDFGYNECKEIVSWLNKINKETFPDMVFIRDVMINCNIEYNEKTILIQIDDKDTFYLKEV